MKVENLEVLHANMDVLITGLDVCHAFELKGSFTDSTVWNTGETGDIYHHDEETNAKKKPLQC